MRDISLNANYNINIVFKNPLSPQIQYLTQVYLENIRFLWRVYNDTTSIGYLLLD